MVIHFGREPGTKAYRLYNPITGRVHVNRDVVFDERKGWSWEELENSCAQMPGHFVLEEQESDTPDITNEESAVTQSSPSTPVSSTQSIQSERSDSPSNSQTFSLTLRHL